MFRLKGLSNSFDLAGIIVGLAAVMTVAAPAHAFLDNIFPGKDTKDEFEGRYIDTISSGAWTPPLERLEKERAEREKRQASQHNDIGDDSRDYGVRSEEGSGPPTQGEMTVPIVRDGVTLLRMSADGLVPENELHAYLNALLARLKAHSPRSNVPSSVVILGGRNYHEAVAMPDGVIGVPLAFLRDAETEDEVAAVMAHELAHVILEHHDQDWYDKAQSNLISSGVFAVSLASDMAAQTGVGGRFAGESWKYILAADAASAVVDKGLFPSLTREQEDEADLLGLDLMIAAGFNYEGMADFLGNLQEIEESLEEQKAEATRQRQAATNEAVNDQMSQGNVSGAVGAVASELGGALDDIFGSTSKEHRSAEDRLDSLFDYLDREYLEKGDFQEPEDSRPLKVTKTKSAKALFQSYDYIASTVIALQKTDIDLAKQESDRFWKGAHRYDDWALFTRSQVWMAKDNLKNQQINLKRAVQSPLAPLEIYRSLSRSYYNSGARGDGVAVAIEAWDIFQKPPQFYPDIIFAYHQAGNQAQVRELVMECQITYRDQAEACKTAAQGYLVQ
ncbi:M48 family metallopeptidase [Rhodovibrionaceae bacterium A322]